MSLFRKKNATPDVPDSRDWLYKPALAQLKPTLDPPGDSHILYQGTEGACTGFALAAAINNLYVRAEADYRVSPRMLYEMARRHDEWPGEEYDGSSLRGAIKGWRNMGVCEESHWPYVDEKPGELSVDAAKNAREHTLGAYYRIKPQITDFHAALNESGVLVASARVHPGWDAPADGIIQHHEETEGGHAFALVGYNQQGFWVQNSWGRGWGRQGLALWTYPDWIANVMDAWVFRLALPTPQLFGLKPGASRLAENGKVERSHIHRSKIAGHFVHVDDGAYKTSGRYWSSSDDVKHTARRLADSDKYRHILIYAHGGLNAPTDSARRIHAMKKTFKDNGIYPFHIMYDTGLVEELKDVVFRKSAESEERVGGLGDWTDRFLEGLLRMPGSWIWNEMKRDAEDAFARRGAATDALKQLLHHLRNSHTQISWHLAGHSTGAIAIAHLLQVMRRYKLPISTCSLMAPACRMDLYQEAYVPALKSTGNLSLDELALYVLKDELELDDNVLLYRKSLLYLVSRALEDGGETALLGMEKYHAELNLPQPGLSVHYSNGLDSQACRSQTHQGFDNDPVTMNHILGRILGHAPEYPFDGDILGSV